jgi:protein-disulfide isomerase
VTDKKDDYYQPWLRDTASAADSAPAAPIEEGLAKPKDTPPVGIDLSRYPASETPPRAPRLQPGQVASGARKFWAALRSGAGAFADWTIDMGERADIPARVEAMEIPRRSRDLAARSGAATARTARAIGSGSASAARGIAATSGTIWRKMALGQKVAKLSTDAGRGLGEAAGKTRAGIGQVAGQVARAGREGIGDAAAKLRATPREEVPPPPSGLEQLLAREAAEAPKAAPAGAPDLPLFAADPPVAAPHPSKAAPAAVLDDDRSPHVAPPAAPSPRTVAPLTAAGGFARRGWLLGLVAVALIATSYWLGGRFGGGMSRGEVETIVADYIKANPQIIPDALEAERGRQMAKAIDAIRPALEKPYAGAWAGNADGDVTLVVFTDYACGFCRASVPDIDRLIREDKRVKIVFRELPIIAPQSRDAALMALAAARQGKYDAFHHAMFASSSLDPAGIAAAAAKVGVITDGSADATANEALFQRELDSNLAIANQLQLNATPTWVVGDQLLQGQIGYAGLRAAVAKARAKG